MGHGPLRLLFTVGLVTTAAAAGPLGGLRPVEPQPTARELAPGLAVRYTYAIVNHLDELKGRPFEPGPPLPHLNYRMGSGTVLTSKASDGVGALITGFIRLERVGVYVFDVTSNDGVRVELGGQLLYEDPTVHADDTSDPIEVRVDRPGWYPLSVAYFEKRHTATLILRWRPPGEPGPLSPVPPAAFAHRRP